MTPDAAAGRPTTGLDWLKGLLPHWVDDPALAEVDARLRRLEAEAERARQEQDG